MLLDTQTDIAWIQIAGAVVVAVVGTVGSVFLAKANKSAKETKAAIGTPNGNGNISQMAEALLLNQRQLMTAADEHYRTQRDWNEEHDHLDDIRFGRIFHHLSITDPKKESS